MAKYYNSMITGADRSIHACQEVYERLRGYNIFVIADCGFGMDGTCDKRIRYDGLGGIEDVRNAFETVIRVLGFDLEWTVNSKKKCEF